MRLSKDPCQIHQNSLILKEIHENTKVFSGFGKKVEKVYVYNSSYNLIHATGIENCVSYKYRPKKNNFRKNRRTLFHGNARISAENARISTFP